MFGRSSIFSPSQQPRGRAIVTSIILKSSSSSSFARRVQTVPYPLAGICHSALPLRKTPILHSNENRPEPGFTARNKGHASANHRPQIHNRSHWAAPSSCKRTRLGEFRPEGRLKQMSSGNINTARPAQPVRQFTPGPPNSSGVDYVKENISKQQRSNFHSSSLNRSHITMVAERVNKTALHPGGVAYVTARQWLST